MNFSKAQKTKKETEKNRNENKAIGVSPIFMNNELFRWIKFLDCQLPEERRETCFAVTLCG